MPKITTFRCHVCSILSPKIFEFQPRITKKIIVGDQVQSIPIEDATTYDVCSEECAIRVLKKVGKVLFHPEIKKKENHEKTDK